MIEIIYYGIIIMLASYVYFRTNKIYRLTEHKGLRFFRQSFFFYAVTFLTLIILNLTSIKELDILFNYSLSIAGFLLVFSMIWKDFDDLTTRNNLLHLASIIIAFINHLVVSYLTFVIQVAIFSYALIIIYNKYKVKQKSKFLQLYLIAIILGLLGYLINFINIFVSVFLKEFSYFTYVFTIAIFGIISFIVYKSLK